MVTREQACHLAALVRTLRPAWDELTTINQLAALRDRDLADVAHFAIRVAEDTTQRTPAALGFADSPHWATTRNNRAADQAAVAARHDTIAARRRAIEACNLCDDRGYTGAYVCLHNNSHAAIAARGAAAARAAIRPGPAPITTEETK